MDGNGKVLFTTTTTRESHDDGYVSETVRISYTEGGYSERKTENKPNGTTVCTETESFADGSYTTVKKTVKSDGETTIKTTEKTGNKTQTRAYRVSAYREVRLIKKGTKVSSGAVTIPKSVLSDGARYRVTSIAKNAFKGNKKIKLVTILADRLSFVGKNAFKGISPKARIMISGNKKQFRDTVKRIKKSGIGKKVRFIRIR
ncbi:MAG TPA: hypothetical protein DCP06_06095 [Lachnospiraceae bacterium]|nr:hypothetical protein [Lachnospiraceae bacterium]